MVRILGSLGLAAWSDLANADRGSFCRPGRAIDFGLLIIVQTSFALYLAVLNFVQIFISTFSKAKPCFSPYMVHSMRPTLLVTIPSSEKAPLNHGSPVAKGPTAPQSAPPELLSRLNVNGE